MGIAAGIAKITRIVTAPIAEAMAVTLALARAGAMIAASGRQIAVKAIVGAIVVVVIAAKAGVAMTAGATDPIAGDRCGYCWSKTMWICSAP